MSQDWLPGAEQIPGPHSGGNDMLGGDPKVTHHITTGGTYDFLKGFLIQRGFEPTLLVDPVGGQIGQFLPASRGGYAMEHTTAPTNTQGSRHIQIEWMWESMSNLTIDKAPKWVEVWGRVLAFCRANGVPDHIPFGSINTPTSRDTNLWVQGGHAGHFNAPGNSHSDGLPVSDQHILFGSTPAPAQETPMALLYVLPDKKTVVVADSQSKRHVNDPTEENYMRHNGLAKDQDPIPLTAGSPDDKYLARLPWAGGKP